MNTKQALEISVVRARRGDRIGQMARETACVALRKRAVEHIQAAETHLGNHLYADAALSYRHAADALVALHENGGSDAA